MVNCQHAASGCNYPQGECTGACLSDNTQRQPAAPQYLTIVYQIHSPGQAQAQALLHATDWAACSHGHAIHDRNGLQAELLDTQAQRLAAFRAIEKLNDELGKVSEQRDEYADAILAIVDREDNDCMPAGWSLDRVREIARNLRRSSSDRAVRRQHDEDYLVHDVESTRTGRAA